MNLTLLQQHVRHIPSVQFELSHFAPLSAAFVMLVSLTSLTVLAIAIHSVHAETHTVHFVNQCGFGSPTLVQGSTVLSSGGAVRTDYTSEGPLLNAIGYLQTGDCGLDGEGCTTVATNLTNGDSSTIISFGSLAVSTGFTYFNGCDGLGEDCTLPFCIGSQPIGSGQPTPPVVCTAPNVDLEITFCD
ncbi:hypothetical protein B0H11DRAFT_2244054 [Mycena galericulata]|nr:hypothetical protein B0H11DRAFT_2244054 [Mycena galericulata]